MVHSLSADIGRIRAGYYAVFGVRNTRRALCREGTAIVVATKMTVVANPGEAFSRRHLDEIAQAAYWSNWRTP
jgi:hypothetical protein